MKNYQRLGDYIREVNVRNSELKVTKLVGLTIDKAFIPSVANVIGTDLSNYKVIRKEQFACSLMQVSRDGKMPVAMFEEDEAIMSPAYPMFEVVDKTELLPQYLMMWFSRKEFDREASFYAVGGVRGSLTWEDFCNLCLPIPSIARQREIVEEYETLSRRIRLNEQMIARLEETAQALYRKLFVDGIDKENLPEGWRRESIFDIANVIYGYPFDSELFCNDTNLTPIIRIRDILDNRTDTYTSECVDNKYKINDGDILIGMDGVFHMTIWSGGLAFQNQRIVKIIPRTDRFIPTYQLFFSVLKPIKELETSIEGTTVTHLSDKDMKKMTVIVAPEDFQKNIYATFESFKRNVIVYKKENLKLTELQSLLLARLGN